MQLQGTKSHAICWMDLEVGELSEEGLKKKDKLHLSVDEGTCYKV